MKYTVAIEGGGTRTRAGLYDDVGVCVAEVEGGASNPADLGLPRSIGVVCELVRGLHVPEDGTLELIALAVAGAGSDTIRSQLATGLIQALEPERVLVTHDLKPILATSVPEGEALVVVAGTGSCVLARNAAGEELRVGGWGPLFRDAGSAHTIALEALNQAAGVVDGLKEDDTRLVDDLPPAAGLEHMRDFKHWQKSASRSDIAALCRVVVNTAEKDDLIAELCIDIAAGELALYVLAVIERADLVWPFPIIVHGGLFENVPRFRESFGVTIQADYPDAEPASPHICSHEAVYRFSVGAEDAGEVVCMGRHDANALPATEQVPIDQAHPDKMTTAALVETMSSEDARAAEAVAAQSGAIARAIEAVATAFANGGRLIYVGAGTSGRLGVLDAAECPPTFGVPPGQVVGLIAGGDEALTRSIEGAEDDPACALADLNALEPPLGDADVVAGISASGTAPYVRAALEEAQRLNATTLIITCNPVPREVASVIIALDTGPEVLAGSTRLKAGTATKMVLNQITTGAMTRAGLVYEGLMVGMKPVNEKLRRRAIRIVATLTGLSATESASCLEKAGDAIPVAVIMAKFNVNRAQAEQRLSDAGGTLRGALEST